MKTCSASLSKVWKKSGTRCTNQFFWFIAVCILPTDISLSEAASTTVLRQVVAICHTDNASLPTNRQRDAQHFFSCLPIQKHITHLYLCRFCRKSIPPLVKQKIRVRTMFERQIWLYKGMQKTRTNPERINHKSPFYKFSNSAKHKAEYPHITFIIDASRVISNNRFMIIKYYFSRIRVFIRLLSKKSKNYKAFRLVFCTLKN